MMNIEELRELQNKLQKEAIQLVNKIMNLEDMLEILEFVRQVLKMMVETLKL